MEIRPMEICPLDWWVDIFRSTRRVFLRCRVGERMISACVVPTVKHGGGVMVWGCLTGDTVCDLFRIQGTLNQHGYHSILQQYAILSGLRLVGLPFVFQTQHAPARLLEKHSRWSWLRECQECAKLSLRQRVAGYLEEPKNINIYI